MEDTLRDQILEAVAEALPEHKVIMEWIENGGVTDLTDRIIELIVARIKEES